MNNATDKVTYKVCSEKTTYAPGVEYTVVRYVNGRRNRVTGRYSHFDIAERCRSH